MDLNVIEKLMKDMDESSLTKLMIEYEGVKICMEKAATSNVGNTEYSFARDRKQSICADEPIDKDVRSEEIVHANEEQQQYSYVTSPMVGTFYESASPEQPPYVKVGDYVKKGQTICIIESMKLMNEIEAEVEGEVVAILVTDKDMVEYGQRMFVILPK